MVQISAMAHCTYASQDPHQRQFQAIVANKSGVIVRHKARSDTKMRNNAFREGGGWLRLAAVFAVESNGLRLKCYARLTNTQILCLLSLATLRFRGEIEEQVIYISDEEQPTTVMA